MYHKEGVHMKKPLLFARELVCSALKAGGLAVDATCGNGHDTVFLAQQAGEQGTVLAFDIQPEALSNTRRRLEDAGFSDRVTLIAQGHEHLTEHMHGRNADAVMFNLGYLPGGNHAVVTKAETTKAAILAAVGILNHGGIITIMVYTGHPGGKEEYQAVRETAAVLPQREFWVLEYKFLNQQNDPPLLVAITRL
ncbi:MAG: class I SAM-dependent methyltransferase [Bacillota bacterium]|nr:class I SAM-dependent methyltransferase [Bacillota bacterium]MDW7683981.1 class I SAM-dependent methyltransferase [Bacillota bacterium]